MIAETKKVLATCVRHPAGRFTRTVRPHNAIASAHRKWLILVEFGDFLSNLERKKIFFWPAALIHVTRRRSRTPSDPVL